MAGQQQEFPAPRAEADAVSVDGVGVNLNVWANTTMWDDTDDRLDDNAVRGVD